MTVADVVALFNAAMTASARRRAMRVAARLSPTDQMLCVDAIIDSHWRIHGRRA